jgi:AraC-like DNA-binding protein
MPNGIRILAPGGPDTRLGRLVVAGEVVDDVPRVDGPYRVLDAYVLSVVLRGRGLYRYADGRSEPIGPGTHTVIRPGVAHWYGTERGQRWTELFAVFTGPLFHTFADRGVPATDGPQHPNPVPSIAVLRAALSAPARTASTSEHQLLALADWLLDATRQADPHGPGPDIAVAAQRLANDLTARLDLPSLAAEVGLSYDAFRRRFAREIGVAPAAYRNAARLRTAAALLRHTTFTVRRIARTLGYADEFHLSRRFRAQFGVSPSRYRAGG